MAEPGSAPMTGMWRDGQHVRVAASTLRHFCQPFWGLPLNFDASLHNEHSPTHKKHENLTDFFRYRFCSSFSLVARNRFMGAHTCIYPFFLPTPPLAAEASFTSNTPLQLPLRSCFLHRIPCNTYSPHCRYKKNTTGGLGNGNKGPGI